MSNKPKIYTYQQKPVLNVFSTSRGFGDLDDTIPGSNLTEVNGPPVGSDRPWSGCGVELISDRPCLPVPYRSDICETIDLVNRIEPDFRYGLDNVAVPNVFEDPDLPNEPGRQPKLFVKDDRCGCYQYQPLTVHTPIKTRPVSNNELLLLRARTVAEMEANCNESASRLLTRSTNGNPSLPVFAKDISANAAVSPAAAIKTLQNNIPYLLDIVLPWEFIGQLAADRHINNQDGRLTTQWGGNIVTDFWLKGLTGPPAAGPWDGTGVFDPTQDLSTAAVGEKWVYATTNLVVDKTATMVPFDDDGTGDIRIKRNQEIAFAETKVMATFDPCNVYAIRVNSQMEAC